jgi:hypothetical protein
VGGGVLVVETTSALPEARGGTGFFGSNADAAVWFDTMRRESTSVFVPAD